jgi:hypothetical protein
MSVRHIWTGFAGLLLLAGCRGAPVGTRIDVATFDEAGQPKQHYTNFRGATYRLSPGGLLEVVMRAQRPSSVDPTQTIEQVLYIKSFWNPQPARSFIDSSQIDARAQFAMLTPPTGVRYDGTAMVTYRFDKKTRQLSGWIESGTLTPRFRMGNALEPFGPANFTGTFVAHEKPGDVVNTAQMLENQFNRPLAGAAK